MKVAFDFEGAIDKHPEVGALMHELTRTGHTTWVVFTEPQKSIYDLLQEARIQPGSYSHTAEVRQGYVAKAYFCLQHGIDLFVDNEMHKINEIELKRCESKFMVAMLVTGTQLVQSRPNVEQRVEIRRSKVSNVLPPPPILEFAK